jgi:hypothetical protein
LIIRRILRHGNPFATCPELRRFSQGFV